MKVVVSYDNYKTSFFGIGLVRRRGAQPADGQIRPRGSGLPTPSQGGIPGKN